MDKSKPWLKQIMVKLNPSQFHGHKTKRIDMNAGEKLVGSSWRGQGEKWERLGVGVVNMQCVPE